MSEKEVISIKVTPELKEAIEAAAQEADLTRHAWMTLVLKAAAGVSNLPTQLLRIVEFQPSKKVKDGEW